MFTGKIHIETRHSKEQLQIEVEVAGKKIWREFTTLPQDYQHQVIASNPDFRRFLVNGSTSDHDRLEIDGS